MRRSRFGVRLFDALLALLLASGSLHGANLLQNPGFDANVGSWTLFGSGTTALWRSEDAGGSPASGSAAIVYTGSSFNGGLTQCVAVAAGVPHHLLVRARHVTPGPPADLFLLAEFFGEAGCGGSALAFSSSPATTSSAWGLYGFAAPVKPPAAARSARISIAASASFGPPFPTLLVDDALFAEEALETLTIPAAASIHGANGTFFQTDLWLVNLSPVLSASVALRHRCPAGASCNTAARSVSLPPRGSRRYADVLASLFGDAESFGAIELTFDTALARLAVLSRTYSPSLPAPTTGTAVPALAASAARTRSVLVGLAAGGASLASGFRTNVGFYNPNASPATVTLVLYDESGAPLGAPVSRTLGANEPLQVNDVFAAAGSSSTVGLNAVAVVTASAPVFSYATVLDNQSADSIFVAGEADPATAWP